MTLCSPTITWKDGLFGLPLVQCAAVRTWRSLIKVPPQNGRLPPWLTNATCQGREYGVTSDPPTIDAGFTPQAKLIRILKQLHFFQYMANNISACYIENICELLITSGRWWVWWVYGWGCSCRCYNKLNIGIIWYGYYGNSEMNGLLSSSYTFTTISRACPVASGWRIIVFAVIIATCETTNTMWISIAVTSSYITLIGRWAAAPVGNRNTIALSRGNGGCWSGYRRCRFYCKTIWSCEFDK